MDNLSDIPLIALSDDTKKIISNLLNPIKTILAKNTTLTRDWRGLADFCGITADIIPVYSHSIDPTNEILNIMIKKNLTISYLIDCLEKIDRWDIIDDIELNINNDLQDYKKRVNAQDPVVLDKRILPHILTKDDIERAFNKKKLKKYHTFFLYDINNNKFANYILNGLENLYNISICDRKRDLIKDDLATIKKVIEERCNSVIILLSNGFIKDEMTETILTYIERINKPMIPLVCTRFSLPVPRALVGIVFISYEYFYKQYDDIGFWKKLSSNLHLSDNNLRDKNIIIQPYEFFNEDLQLNKLNTTVNDYVPLIEAEPVADLDKESGKLKKPEQPSVVDDHVPVKAKSAGDLRKEVNELKKHKHISVAEIVKVKKSKTNFFFGFLKKKKKTPSDSLRNESIASTSSGAINSAPSLSSDKKLNDENSKVYNDNKSSAVDPDNDNTNNSNSAINNDVLNSDAVDESISLPSLGLLSDPNDSFLKAKKCVS